MQVYQQVRSLSFVQNLLNEKNKSLIFAKSTDQTVVTFILRLYEIE
jgi:hypothetical protein